MTKNQVTMQRAIDTYTAATRGLTKEERELSAKALKNLLAGIMAGGDRQGALTAFEEAMPKGKREQHIGALMAFMETVAQQD